MVMDMAPRFTAPRGHNDREGRPEVGDRLFGSVHIALVSHHRARDSLLGTQCHRCGSQSVTGKAYCTMCVGGAGSLGCGCGVMVGSVMEGLLRKTQFPLSVSGACKP